MGSGCEQVESTLVSISVAIWIVTILFSTSYLFQCIKACSGYLNGEEIKSIFDGYARVNRNPGLDDAMQPMMM